MTAGFIVATVIAVALGFRSQRERWPDSFTAFAVTAIYTLAAALAEGIMR